MKSPNFVAIDPAFGKAGKGFVAAGAPVERRFTDAHFLTTLQPHSKPFRCVAPGMLLVGSETRLVFTGGAPAGVLLPPHLLNEFEPHWLARGLAWSEEGLCKLDNAGLSADPTTLPDGSRVRGYGWQLPLTPVEEAWAAVKWTLSLGFSAEDFALFATAPRGACLVFLREAAHYFIQEQLGLVHPRARLEIYKKVAAVLPRFSKADAASAEARALFDEALLATVTGAPAAGLLVLVNALTSASEGGAAAAG